MTAVKGWFIWRTDKSSLCEHALVIVKLRDRWLSHFKVYVRSTTSLISLASRLRNSLYLLRRVKRRLSNQNSRMHRWIVLIWLARVYPFWIISSCKEIVRVYPFWIISSCKKIVFLQINSTWVANSRVNSSKIVVLLVLETRKPHLNISIVIIWY